MQIIEQKPSKKKWIIWSLVIIIVFSGIMVYTMAQSPRRQAKKEAIAMAEKYGHLEDVDDFYLYDRQSVYYTVAGTDNKNNKVYVVIPKKGNKVNIFLQSKGITAKKAIAITKKLNKGIKVKKAALGFWDGDPTWEITYLNQRGNLCYDLIDYRNGKIVKTIQNI
ncbi:DUF5590 domain-containing protein [Ligilactobacillus ceti]|uniref:Uncharacterized protein n=1 Tax=Ligilactobacillus ceti DSM 22408 TaxID=1122146 RepID=A0A0R2KQT6_9LACO|nr:DUF5590 domain-containing protein [Ligilactobacillus ceti]KRN88906.1 hypothetical protein IV53_GL000876 [Ligilactobacillus ceti DSM 22408]